MQSIEDLTLSLAVPTVGASTNGAFAIMSTTVVMVVMRMFTVYAEHKTSRSHVLNSGALIRIFASAIPISAMNVKHTLLITISDVVHLPLHFSSRRLRRWVR